MRERYPDLNLDPLPPSAPSVNALVKRHGPNLFYRSVENRLLCCQVRKVLPLQRVTSPASMRITGSAATSGRRAATSARSRSTTTTARS
jgi:phosphoadenosine phosphosulfate reductase